MTNNYPSHNEPIYRSIKWHRLRGVLRKISLNFLKILSGGFTAKASVMFKVLILIF